MADRSTWEAEFDEIIAAGGVEPTSGAAATTESVNGEEAAPAAAAASTTDSSTAGGGEPAPATTDAGGPGAAAPQADAAADPAPGTDADTPAAEQIADPADAPAPAAEAARPDPEQPAQPAHQPFGFRADGREVQVPDSYVVREKVGDEEHEFIVIRRAAFDRHVQPHLADRSAWREREHDFRQQIAALQPSNNPTIKTVERVLSEVDTVVQDRSEGWEDRLLDWAEKYAGNRSTWQQEAERESRTAQDSARATVLTDDQVREQFGVFEQVMGRALDAEIGANTAFRGIDRNAVLEDLQELVHVGGLAALFFEAPDDMPEAGLKKGETGIRLDVIERRLQRVSARESARREAEARARAAEEKNAAALRPRPNTPAPVPVTTGAPGASEPKRPKSRDEWERDFEDSLIAAK